MERRALGKTGEKLSMVGFGGIVVMNEEPDDAARLVAQAVERGINYFDVAPSYGNAEERLGPALAPYRRDVFLACKTTKRDSAGAAEELRESLRRLQTDYFDLYQFHGVTRMDEVDVILSSGGAMEAVLEARRAGLVRHIGFSAHSDEAALALMNRFPFDSILFPVNWVCWHEGHFGPRVLARAAEQGVGVLCLKTLAHHPWQKDEERTWPKCWYRPLEEPEMVTMAARFTLSQPITAALGPGHAQLLWHLCDAAEHFRRLTASEASEVARQAAGITPIFRSSLSENADEQ